MALLGYEVGIEAFRGVVMSGTEIYVEVCLGVLWDLQLAVTHR